MKANNQDAKSNVNLDSVDQWLFQPDDISIHCTTGLEKHKQYSWKALNEMGQLEYIDKRMLFVDKEYQREIKENMVADIASKFTWPRFGVLTVYRRNGRYMVADGQHRFHASMRRSDVSKLPCIVFKCDFKSVEAEAFIDINTGARAVSNIAKYKAGIIAKIPHYIALKSIFDLHGLTPGVSQRINTLQCVGVFMDTVKANGVEAVKEITSAVIYSNPECALQENVVKAVRYMYRKHSGIPKKMLEDIRRVGHFKIKKAIDRKVILLGRGGEKAYASGLCDALNCGKKPGTIRWSVE